MTKTIRIKAVTVYPPQGVIHSYENDRFKIEITDGNLFATHLKTGLMKEYHGIPYVLTYEKV